VVEQRRIGIVGPLVGELRREEGWSIRGYAEERDVVEMGMSFGGGKDIFLKAEILIQIS
jgi:hypothetical protein